MQKLFRSLEIFQSAALCDARRRMSWTELETHFIVTATAHANDLGIGYFHLLPEDLGWVLSRMSIKVYRWPTINDRLWVESWVDSFNRFMSRRDFRMVDAQGNVLAEACSVWVCINLTTRRPSARPWPEECLGADAKIAPELGDFPRLGAIESPCYIDLVNWAYRDIDFYGHVNSARYVEHLVDAIHDYCKDADDTCDDFDNFTRMDIAYLHEARLGDPAVLRLAEYELEPTSEHTDAHGTEAHFEIRLGDGTPICRARFS